MSATVDVRFHRVASGLKLIYTSLILTVLLVVGSFVFGIALAASGAARNAGQVGGGQAVVTENAYFIYTVVAIGLLISALTIIGKVSCLNVPEKVQATGPISAAVALTVMAIILSLSQQFAGLPESVGSIAQLLNAGAWFCFLVFLRRLAEFLGDQVQINRARSLFKGTIIAGVLFVAFGVGLLLATQNVIDPSNTRVLGLGMIGVSIYGLILFVRYANLVNGLRKHLARVLVSHTLE